MATTPTGRPQRSRAVSTVLLTGAVVAVLTLTGCSGDASSKPGPTSPATTTTGTGSTTSSTVSPVTSSAPASSGPTSGAAPAATPPARAGVTFGSTLYALSARDLDRALDDVVALRMSWIRIDLSWAGIQPVSASRYDWSDVDAVVDAAARHKLQIMGLVTYTPPWARAAGCRRFSCPPRRNSEFAAFAATAVRRYAPKGLRTYQVWNEPNITAFWSSPDAGAYGALLAATVSAIRDAAAGVRVLFGSLAFTGDDASTRVAGNIDAAPFLRRACAAHTCDVDAVGYDPYTYPRLPSDTGAPLNAWQRIANPAAGSTSLHAAMIKVGLRRATVWITAFGAPTTYSGASDKHLVSEQRQAAILTDGAQLAGRSPSVIGAYFVNTLRDNPSAGPLGGHFGLVRTDGTHKPAFAALAAALAR